MSELPIIYRTPTGKYEVTCRLCTWKSAYEYERLSSAQTIGRLHVQIKHEPTPKEVILRNKAKKK